ncbi:MAG TPA: CopD family protein [Gaiellaceae bacterium]|nr:CopD family protein [Gaiellaceae bacterium]
MTSRRRWAPLLAVAVATVVFPAAASAHALLLNTEPLRGAVVKHAPDRVVFHFNEPVETVFSAVHVFDGAGRKVDDGHVTHPEGRKQEVAIGVRDSLGNGTYTATYRVISADGHPVSGGFVFSIGTAGAAPRFTVEQLTQKASASLPIRIAFDAARGLEYLALALAIGGVIFLFGPWFGGLRASAGAGGEWESAADAFLARARRLLFGSVALGVAAGIAGILLQGATAAGTSVLSAAKPSVVRDVAKTDFGMMWSIRVGVWLVFALVLALAVRRERAPVLRPATLSSAGQAMSRRFPHPKLALVGLAPLAFLTLSPALAGHAHTESPTWALVPANAFHVLAMSAWLGGITMIAFALPKATRRLQTTDRTRLLAGVVGRFSTLAGIAIAVVVATGLIQSLVLVRHLHNLVDTGYGKSVLVKICVLTGILALGAVNRQRLVPALRRQAELGETPGRTGTLLRRTIRLEIVIALAILGATGVLAGLAPSTAVPRGPFAKTTRLGPAELQLTVDPARVGRNLVHLYLLNPTDGSQYDRVKELTMAFTLPSKDVGAISVEGRKAGPGHYVVDNAVLGIPGTWSVSITARVSDFDEYTTDLQVPIR